MNTLDRRYARASATIATALTAALLFTSCAPVGDSDGDASTDRQIARYGISASDIGTLDPHQASSGFDRMIVSEIFSGLTRLSPTDFRQIEPDLAVEIPEPSIDDQGRQVWEFTLREGVMCHEGPETEAYELTSEDVVYSLERSRDPERSSYASEYDVIEDVKADGDYGVVITLSEPRSAPLFLQTVANYSAGHIVCSQAVEAVGDEAFAAHPVGTGPFFFQSHIPGQRVELVANDDFYRDAPGLAGIDVVFMANENSRELALQSGDLDLMILSSDERAVQRLEDMDGISATATPFGGPMILFFNTSIEPLDDVRVREAITLGIDPAAHRALGGESVFTPAYASGVPEGGDGGLTEEDARERGVLREYDPDRARELLIEAGYPDGFSMKLMASEIPQYNENYQVLQEEMAQIGIEVEVQTVDHASYGSIAREGRNALHFASAPRPNQDQVLTQFFHSDSIVVGGRAPISNYTFWGGADDLIEAARDEVDPGTQAELWKDAYTLIAEEYVAFTPYVATNAVAWRDDFDWGRDLGLEIRSSFHIDEAAKISR